MLMGLILRGVAFEFRFKADEAHRPFWDQAFACGSYIGGVLPGRGAGRVHRRLQGDRPVL